MIDAAVEKSVVVIGKNGQLARALSRIGSISGMLVTNVGRPEIDLTESSSLESVLSAANPALVINAAAYTAVEKAESEPELAFAVNAEAVDSLAQICGSLGVPFITVSTDYVFDGSKNSPYAESDPVCPINVYGASKAEGEERVRRRLQEHLILRTSWVYSWEGRNFLLTMADRIAKSAETQIVTDQIGSPTYAENLAMAIGEAATTALSSRDKNIWGTYHLTNNGNTSWFGFAKEIFSSYADMGLKPPRLLPISAADFPSRVRRPAYSVLDTSLIARRMSITMPHWRSGLAECLTRLQEIGQ
jgi:dTDP-4-dehydrorhamnose reductase